MSRDEAGLIITPDVKVAQLLEAFPQLESLLIRIAPAFAKLRNPLLRKTVAKVTSLRQAANVGGVPLGEMINRLRAEVGQGSAEFDDAAESTRTQPPDWYDEQKISQTIDARPMIERGEQPMALVMEKLKRQRPGEILQLITPFLPAPLIDLAAKQGHRSWQVHSGVDEFRTYFLRSNG